MADYRGMYTELFRAQTEAIEALEGIAVQLRATTGALKTAQQAAEETYMDGEAPVLELLERDKQERDYGEQDEPE